MRTLVIASFAAALLTVAATPLAAAAPSQQKSAAAQKKVCRWIEPRTGSQMRERICLTAEDWKKVEELLAE